LELPPSYKQRHWQESRLASTFVVMVDLFLMGSKQGRQDKRFTIEWAILRSATEKGAVGSGFPSQSKLNITKADIHISEVAVSERFGREDFFTERDRKQA
jgi:hypothetical protein